MSQVPHEDIYGKQIWYLLDGAEGTPEGVALSKALRSIHRVAYHIYSHAADPNFFPW